MSEIRAIHKGEVETFLRLLCSVFALDYSRAESVFFREPFFDLDRKWALFEGGRMTSCLTTVPLTFGDGPAAGIAGVATRTEDRGRGLARELLSEVLRASAAKGEGRSLLFASCETLYEKVGFRSLDTVICQALPQGCRDPDSARLDLDALRPIYDAWSAEHPHRLRRDERRWNYWAWNLKTAHSLPGGYVCCEFGRIREILPAYRLLPFADSVEWFGLRSMGEMLRVPLSDPRPELTLMGCGFDFVPQMFLSDQF